MPPSIALASRRATPSANQLIRTTVLRRQRFQQRKGISLRDTLIKPYTAKLYQRACAWFFDMLSALNLEVPDTIVEFDLLIEDIIVQAWNEGEPRALIGNLLSGLEHRIAGLRG